MRDQPIVSLDWAAKKGDMRVLRRALENGAEISASSQPTRMFPARESWRYGRMISRRFRYTPPHPLCISVEAENQAIIQFLLPRGSDANMRDSEYLSVLSIAVIHGNQRIVRILLSAGANQFWHFDTENYPLQIAAYLGNKEIFDLLLHHDPQGLRETHHLWGSLESALRGRNHHLIPSLLECKINLNSFFAGSPYTPLSFAVKSGDSDTVKPLLDRGANPSFPSPDYWGGGVGSYVGWEGEPALVKAVTRGDEAMVQLLIKQRGASVNAWYQGLYKSQSARSHGSALQLAIDLGQVDIIQFLQDNGAQEEVQSWWKRFFSQIPRMNQTETS